MLGKILKWKMFVLLIAVSHPVFLQPGCSKKDDSKESREEDFRY
jgi:hypothetical protein